MTRASDFKQVVRARMAATGEGYTAARAALEQEAYDAARAEQERLVGRLFTDGRIERVPAKRKVRAAVLLGVHEDFAYLRRELVNYRYLERADGRYRTVAQASARSVIERQEIPAWE